MPRRTRVGVACVTGLPLVRGEGMYTNNHGHNFGLCETNCVCARACALLRRSIHACRVWENAP